MKLVDAPADVVAELATRRVWRPGPTDDLLWFADGCAVCGRPGQGDMDHCHITGLYRGQLCHSCNLDEAFNDTPLWRFWAFNAPGLASRELYDGVRSPHLTFEQSLTLPLAELFAIHAECEARWRVGSAARIRAAFTPVLELDAWLLTCSKDSKVPRAVPPPSGGAARPPTPATLPVRSGDDSNTGGAM